MNYQISEDIFKNNFKWKSVELKGADTLRITHTQDQRFKLFPFKASGKAASPIVTDTKEVIGDFIKTALGVKTPDASFDHIWEKMIDSVEIDDRDVDKFRAIIQSLFYKNGEFVADNIGLYAFQESAFNKSTDRLAVFLNDVLGVDEEIVTVIQQAMERYPYNALEKLVTECLGTVQKTIEGNDNTYFTVFEDSGSKFKTDFKFMLENGMSSPEDLSNLIALYYFYYTSQTCITLDHFGNGKRNEPVEMSAYLDYNATTPLDERVLECMIEVYRNTPGNADSRTHDYGDNARKVVEKGRKQVADLIGVNADEVFFTSGATESNNIALQGLAEYAESSGKKHIITTSIEHKAVLNTAKYLAEHKGYEVEFINPDRSGRISVDDVLSRIRKDTLLVSVMHVNNETGIIQPVKEIGDALDAVDVLFHIDATQSCGKLVAAIKELKYDMLSFSAHKFNGPQGIGALILRKKNYKLPPIKGIYFGGQQEHGIRPGTTPVALVAGMGKACEIAELEFEHGEEDNRAIKTELLKILEKSGVKYELNGNQDYCVDNTMSVSFDGVASEALMLMSKQFCAVSNGSACTSKSYEPSYVLSSMGVPVEQIENTIRISWGIGVNKDEVYREFEKLLHMVKKLA